jgi:PAS domain S-box-containing protein
MRPLDAFISRHSIRTLLIVLILCLTAPTVAAVLFLGQGRFQLKRAEITNQAMDLARAFARKHEDVVLHARTLLEAIANQPGFADLEPETMQAYFARIIGGNPQYSSLIYLRPDGSVLTSSAPVTPRANFGDRDYFRDVLARGGFAVGQTVIGRNTGLPVLPFGAQIPGPSGIRGVLTMGLRLDDYEKFFDALPSPEGTRFVLFDQNGLRLLRHPMRDISPLGVRSQQADTVMTAAESSGAFEAQDQTGELITYAYIRTRTVGGTEGRIGVLVGIPSSHITGQIRSEFVQTLLILCLATGIVLAAGSLAGSRIISSGLIAMQAKVTEITRTKDYAELGEVSGCREVRDLASSFDRMAGVLKRDKEVMKRAEEDLRRSQDELERRVAERTAELTEANLKLRQSEESFRLLIEMAPEAIVVYDCDRERFTDANTRASELFGVPRDTLLSSGPISYYSPKQPNGRDITVSFNEHINRALAGEQVVIERAIRNAEGTDLICEVRMNRLPSQDKKLIRGSFIDITDRKLGEEKLRRINRQLAQVSARAQEMASQAEMANAAKSEFLAKMSHEIRTPMNAIMGMTELAMQLAASPLQRDYLATAMESTRNLLAIINDILDLSKIEAMQVELASVDFDHTELMDSLRRSFASFAESKGIYLRFEEEPSLPRYLKGDPVRLRQILTNLLGNAVKFTQAGGVSLSVGRAEPSQPDKVGLRFVVADTGPGVPPELADFIFKPFTQAKTPAGRTDGTGLGLPISKSLVELMGGSITLDSEPGKGSVFSFDIFLPPGEPVKSQQAEPDPFACIGKSFRILVVDDNQVNLKVASALLARLGHMPATAHGGDEALALLSTGEFEAVLMDLEMAGMDGIETTKRIRAGQAGETAKNVNIVAMTAHALVGYRERCIQAGMNDFIAKPVGLTELIRVLGCAPDSPLLSDKAQFDPAMGRKEALLRLGGDEQLLRELHDDFIKSLPERIKDLSEASGPNNGRALRQLAHSIKGVAAAVGETQASELAARVENAAAHGAVYGPLAETLIAALAGLAGRA